MNELDTASMMHMIQRSDRQQLISLDILHCDLFNGLAMLLTAMSVVKWSLLQW